MSYRMYIASHSKQDEKTRSYIFEKVIIPQLLENTDSRESFPNFEFLSKFGCEVQLELGQEPVIDSIFKKCESYIPKSTLEKYKEYLPQDSTEESYIGILTKELLWEYIQNLHKYQIRYFEKKFEVCKKDKEKAMQFAQQYIANMLMTYETSLEYLDMFEEQCAPYCMTSTFEFFLFKVYELYQKTDFSKTELIVYGW